MMWSGDDWGWGAWLIMSLTMLGFWALVIWAALSVGRSNGSGRDNGQAILAERFARGEIDENEYLRRRELIRSGR